MKKQVGSFTAAAAALVLLCQGAYAGSRDHGVDPTVTATAVAAATGTTVAFLSMNNWRLDGWWDTRRANGLTTGGAYAASAVGCMAVSPMVATALKRRPLTHREAHVLAANCVLPIVGGLLMNAAYQANPHWEPEARPVRRARNVRAARRR